jgi:hypothetical protein
MVSSLDDEHTINECVAAGATAFVKKQEVKITDTETSHLVTTAKRVAQTLSVEKVEELSVEKVEAA